MPIDTARLLEICDTGLAAVGYDLVELEYVHDPSGWVLRVYIDHPYDGQPEPVDELPASLITHTDCELASRHLGTVLDVEDIISSAYRLEVSSPGVPRPLRKERDFARFVGRRARLELREGQGESGRKTFVGVLRSAAAGLVGVEVDGRLLQLPVDGVRRARLEASERRGERRGERAAPARRVARAATARRQGRKKRCSQT